MFRCTDCYKEYQTNPGFCDCGNDQFEEILDTAVPQEQYYQEQYDNQQYDEYGNPINYNDGYAEQYDEYGNPINYDDGYADAYQQEYVAPAPKLQRRSSAHRGKKPMTVFDKVGIGFFVVCIILSILAFIFIGSGQTTATKKDGKPLREKNYSIPSNIDTIWNSTPPKAAPTAAATDPSKILNTRLSSLDSELNAYLISLAQAMIDVWVRDDIQGNGVTQMEFIISPDGKLGGKKIFKFSGNKSLDDSVGMLISSFGDFQRPPSSYNQEIIIISFSAKDGSMKAYYPNVTAK